MNSGAKVRRFWRISARRQLLHYMGIDRVVDNQIKKLRSALGEEGKRIQTVVGRGYKISDA